jgi:hypothetical protein
MPAQFEPEQLRPVLDKLAAWHPQAIAIEAVSGIQCDFMRHYPDRYKDSVEAYCWDPAPAAKATGLDVPAATAAWGRLLATWPAKPLAADRRRLRRCFSPEAKALPRWSNGYAFPKVNAMSAMALMTLSSRGSTSCVRDTTRAC